MSERDEAIQRILDGTPDYCLPTPEEQQMILKGAEDYAAFQWGQPGMGFGNVVFYTMDGQLRCDNECMSKDFIKERLCKMVDDAIMDDDK